uniref:CSON015179 protein n=1 Tax=Culicoides sonorensis TaxID=179676 RepID=A0A336LRP7_CULSO
MFKYVFAILAFVAVAMAAPQFLAPATYSYQSGIVRPSAYYSSGLTYPTAYSAYNTLPLAGYSGYPYAYSYL